MNHVVKIVLALVVSLSLVACSKKDAATNGSTTAASNETAGAAVEAAPALPATLAELKNDFTAKAANGDATAAQLLGVIDAAEKGDKNNQFILGAIYRDGVYIQRNDAEAFKTFSTAADQGEPNAQWFIGLMYENGESVSVDAAKAATWYNKCAASKDKTAAARCKDSLKNLKAKAQ